MSPSMPMSPMLYDDLLGDMGGMGMLSHDDSDEDVGRRLARARPAQDPSRGHSLRRDRD